jgi:hypothetical protein
LVVDIQPIYQDGFGHWLGDFINFINENNDKFNQVVFYYNGEDTVGEISEEGYKWWWLENGLDEHIAYGSKFYDKGYAFFRNCMDAGGDDEDIVNLVKLMIHHDVNDSRELDEDFWNEYVNRFEAEDIRDILELSDDAIHIPDLMDDLKYYNNIVMCGGGEHECLKEVNIALDVLNKPYQILNKYVY